MLKILAKFQRGHPQRGSQTQVGGLKYRNATLTNRPSKGRGQGHVILFTARRCASAVYAVIVCLSVSVCRSVRPSVRQRVAWSLCSSWASCKTDYAKFKLNYHSTDHDDFGTKMFFNEKQLENSKVEHNEIDDIDISYPFKITFVHCESE